MDYEKEYNDVFKRAKELHEAGNALTKSQMEIVFPELKESEDERIRTRLVALVEAFGQGEYKNEMLAYLERQKEQKPAQWSEEDNINLNACIQIINNAWEKAQIKELGTTKFAPHYYGDLIDWLKSLQPHWKPSKDQMKALKVVARGFPTDDPDAIDSLLTDLQKLL